MGNSSALTMNMAFPRTPLPSAGNRRTSTPLLLVAIALAGCGEDGLEGIDRYEPGEVLAVWPTGQDSALLGRARALALNERVMAVLDVADPTVHILDRESNTWRSVGSRGGGPEEFRNLMHVALVGGEIWVSDTGNGRLHRLSTDGAFLGSTPLDVPLYFAQDDRGRTVGRSRDLSYLLQVVSGDSTEYLGEMDALPAAFSDQGRATLMRPNLIMLEPLEPGRFVVADNQSGTVWIASVAGGAMELDEVPLPADLRRQIQQARDRIATAFGGWAPVFGSIHPDGSGGVWVRPIPFGVLGMLIDVDARELRAIVWQSDRDEDRGVHYSVARGDTIFMLTDTNVRAYRLQATNPPPGSGGRAGPGVSTDQPS